VNPAWHLWGRKPVAVGSLLILSLLLAGGCGDQQQRGGFSRPPTPVETARVTQATVVDRFTAVGTIEAGESVTIVSEIDAAVKEIPFAEGQAIAQGALIAQLDDAQLQAEVARTEALRDQNRVTYERIKRIVDQGAGAPQDLDDAAAALKVAAANLDLARARLTKTRIKAPFAGVVGARRISPGAFLRSGTPITDLAQVSKLRISFSAPERYLSRLQRGASVTISTTAFPDHPLQGVIFVIEPQLDPGTRSARVIALADNPEQLLRPGMSADISVVLAERSHALTVPSEAVFVEAGQNFVYVVKPDSTVTRASLELGTRMPDAVEVVSGLTEGTEVVSAGHQKLYEGAKVMPIAAGGPGSGPGGGPPAGDSPAGGQGGGR
jgi:membrane fusion protein (multidrug efflux system)